jgi:hypothetical protein
MRMWEMSARCRKVTITLIKRNFFPKRTAMFCNCTNVQCTPMYSGRSPERASERCCWLGWHYYTGRIFNSLWECLIKYEINKDIRSNEAFLFPYITSQSKHQNSTGNAFQENFYGNIWLEMVIFILAEYPAIFNIWYLSGYHKRPDYPSCRISGASLIKTHLTDDRPILVKSNF